MTRRKEARNEIEFLSKLFVDKCCIWCTDGGRGYKWLGRDPAFCTKHLTVNHVLQFGAAPVTIVIEDLEPEDEERERLIK